MGIDLPCRNLIDDDGGEREMSGSGRGPDLGTSPQVSAATGQATPRDVRSQLVPSLRFAELATGGRLAGEGPQPRGWQAFKDLRPAHMGEPRFVSHGWTWSTGLIGMIYA